jgi:dienelactone hydrolase
MRIFKRILLVLLVILIVAAAAFTIWAYTPLGPMPQALIAMQNGNGVNVQTSPWLTFTPANQQPTTGIIIYPGGRVDYRSYAPTARALAEQGHLAVIVPMPFNLAVFGSGKASDVIKAHPEVTSWAIGGHSLGGAMSAKYAYDNPDAVEGLALWAAYPATNNSLAGRSLSVSSISASNDGLATPEKIEASQPYLPASTQWLQIQGGNHAGFGYYGPQNGDGQATISRAEQQAQTVTATAQMLKELQ